MLRNKLVLKVRFLLLVLLPTKENSRVVNALCIYLPILSECFKFYDSFFVGCFINVLFSQEMMF